MKFTIQKGGVGAQSIQSGGKSQGSGGHGRLVGGDSDASYSFRAGGAHPPDSFIRSVCFVEEFLGARRRRCWCEFDEIPEHRMLALAVSGRRLLPF